MNAPRKHSDRTQWFVLLPDAAREQYKIEIHPSIMTLEEAQTYRDTNYPTSTLVCEKYERWVYDQ
jgi:hypothetical protein